MSGDVVRPHFSSFRRRFSARQPVVGTFIKTPTTHATEIFGALGYDFVVIDEEHAPIDRAMTDVMLLAARASNLAGIVRVSSDDPAKILSCLDCGASGVLVPHVATVEKARAVAAAARYRGGRRGYSGSARAGAYGGTPMWSLVDEQDASVCTIAMIEDPEALDHIDAIAAVDGIHGLFIGRGDLTVALGAKSSAEASVKDAVIRIIAAAKKVAKPVCVMVASRGGSQGFRRPRRQRLHHLVGSGPDAPGRGANAHRFQNPRSNHGWLACITALIPARRSPPLRSAPNPPPPISQAPNMRNSTKRRRRKIRTARAPGTPAARTSSLPTATPTRARR